MLCQIGVMTFQRFWLVCRLPVKIHVAVQTSCGRSTPLLVPPLIMLWLPMEENLKCFGPVVTVLSVINSTLHEFNMLNAVIVLPAFQRQNSEETSKHQRRKYRLVKQPLGARSKK